MSLAENIKTCRKQCGLSQKALGEKLNLSQDTISLWERGISKPGVDELILLADLFEISVDELLDRI